LASSSIRNNQCHFKVTKMKVIRVLKVICDNQAVVNISAKFGVSGSRNSKNVVILSHPWVENYPSISAMWAGKVIDL